MFFNRVRKYKHHQPVAMKFDIRSLYAHKTGADGLDPDAVTITVEQAKAVLKEAGFVTMAQQKFDDIIDEKYGKGYNKAKAELGDVEALNTEIETLKTKLKDAKTDKGDTVSKTEHEHLLKIEQQKTTDALANVDKMKSHQKDNEILKAISPWAVDPDAVLSLTRDKFAIGDDGKVYPIDDKGDHLLDSEGKASVDGYFKKFQKEKTYLVKPTGTPGAESGSDGKGTQAPSGNKSMDELADMPMDQFVKTGGIGSI